jgi:antitoxin component YwqK of YwqJK toxin-antitoxin module
MIASIIDSSKIYKPTWLKYYSKNFVYKSCDKFIVVLAKLPQTMTNEARSNIVDKRYAKFRADTLFVVKIVHKMDQDKKINSVTNTIHYDKKIIYESGKTINVEDYDENMEEICSTGIHYFLSYKAAFFYESDTKFKWSDNGRKESKIKYLDGGFELHVTWFENGQPERHVTVLNGNRSGLYTRWFENGQKYYEGNYLNDKKTGLWIQWFENGQKKCEGNYLNGKKTGLWIEWFENGQKVNDRNYLNGKRIGSWMYLSVDCKEHKWSH